MSVLALIAMSCTMFKNSSTNNFEQLTIGMSKAEVEYWIGPPERYLSARDTPSGWEEILQYRTSYNELFALEFINDYLVAADHIYNDSWYPMYPPAYRPPYGGPVFPPGYRPNHPQRPPSNVRPPANTRSPAVRPSTPSNDSRQPATIRPSAPSNSESPARSSSGGTSREGSSSGSRGR